MTIIGALRAAKAGEKVRKTAPFYSAVDEALANLKRNKGTGAEFYSELKNTKNIKPVELADRRLEEAFKAKGKMTKEEAQQVLADNPPPKVQERILEDIDGDERRRLLDDKMEIYGYDNYREVPHRVLREWNAEIDADAVKYNEPDYVTKGGSNYREILLKLPKSRPDANDYKDPAKYDADVRAYNASGKDDYLSQHWDDKNVLAHMRVQDRMIDQPPQKGFYVVNKTSGRQSEMFDTPEQLQAYVETLPESIRNNVTMAQGERKVPPRKVLQVEEIQSDWHQEGRKKGYRTEKPPYTVEADAYGVYRIKDANGQTFMPYVDGEQMSGFMTPEAAENAAKANIQRFPDPTGVPDAPFKKNWHELAMKRLLNYAAEKGYDGIAITPGAEHFKRYGSERIDWKKGDDGWIVGAKEQTGGRHEGRDLEEIARDRGILLERSGDQVKSKEDLHRIVNTVLNRENNPDQVNKLTNRIWERMQTEAEGTSLPRKEGMEGFYDKMLTDYLNSYGRDYGAQVQQVQFPIKHELQGLRNMGGYPDEPPLTLHNFPITPEMRESIKQKGLPLYQQVGIPTAGAASQMLEPEEEPQYGPGGAIRKMALKAAPAPKAPQIIKPSGLTELRKIIEQEKGGYGSRRLERAADEVPNLEKMYNERALKDVFTGDNARALMTMNPADFEEYAMRLSPRNVSVPGFIGDKQRQSTEDYVKYLTSLDRFDDVPFLLINKEEQGLPLMPFISGHEGRHRNRSLVKRGEQTGLVQLLPRAELREPFPRRSQQEYIEALKEEMEMTGNKVKPESYFDDSLPKNLFIERPPIKLPDIYAKGGAVKPKVKDSKSGRVRMTENRDTMFMELSNKKLKRK